jgi:hypothetical protein
MLVAIPLALDPELRENVTFWGIPVMAVIAFLCNGSYRFFAMGVRIQLVRELLRASDGMTVAQIAESVGTDTSHVHRMLHKFPDAYIDRWIKVNNHVTAVWCVVIPPPNCPRPESRRNK